MKRKINVWVRERELPLREEEIEQGFKKGRRRIYLDIYVQGKRRYEPVGILPREVDARSRREARELRMLAQSMAQERKSVEERRLKGGVPDVDPTESFVAFFREQAEKRANPGTRAGWEKAVDWFEELAGSDVRFVDLDHTLIERFARHLANKLNGNTALVYLSKLSSACNAAIQAGYLGVNPCRGVTVKKEQRLPRFLTIEQVRQLRETPVDQNIGNAFLFGCFSGLRLSDVDSLKWSQVKEGVLTFTQKKTGQPERIPLSPSALAILEAQKKTKPSKYTKRSHPADNVFRLPNFQRVHVVLRQWGERAEIDVPLSFHVSRHTYATLLVTGGADLFVVSKLLGHKSIRATQIYSQVIDKKKSEAVALLPQL